MQSIPTTVLLYLNLGLQCGKLAAPLSCLSRTTSHTHSRPIIEEANRIAPAFAKIFKEMIIVTEPDRPLPRAGKGTVIRKQALEVYEKEVNDL